MGTVLVRPPGLYVPHVPAGVHAGGYCNIHKGGPLLLCCTTCAWLDTHPCSVSPHLTFTSQQASLWHQVSWALQDAKYSGTVGCAMPYHAALPPQGGAYTGREGSPETMATAAAELKRAAAARWDSRGHMLTTCGLHTTWGCSLDRRGLEHVSSFHRLYP